MRSWLIVAYVCIGCSEPTSPREIETLGVVAGYSDHDPRVQISATRGEIAVTVLTYGVSCHYVGRTVVEHNGSEIIVSPYDRVADDNAPCYYLPKDLVHSVSVSIPKAGHYSVAIRGLRMPARDTVRTTRLVTVPD